MNNVSNEALVEAGLAVIQPSLAPAERVARGRGFVNVQRFSNTGSARQVKDALKAANPKASSKALSRLVNETLRGERDVRQQLAMAWLQGQFQNGAIPSHGEESANGFVLRGKILPVASATVAVETPKVPETAEEVEKALAELTAKLAALKAGQNK